MCKSPPACSSPQSKREYQAGDEVTISYHSTQLGDWNWLVHYGGVPVNNTKAEFLQHGEFIDKTKVKQLGKAYDIHTGYLCATEVESKHVIETIDKVLALIG